jgi:sugar phosphate isomerase/epimerase
MMRYPVFWAIGLVLCLVFCAEKTPVPDSTNPEGTAKTGSGIPETSDARIRRFPIAVQCWTFRKFTFFESLQKIKDLGILAVQAYPGQMLDKGDSTCFDHRLSDDRLRLVKDRLAKLGMSLAAYGVVGDLENTEGGMRPVFEFARKLSIPMIVAEPRFEDFTLLEKLATEYGIKVAIHNHPEPSIYARPDVVLARIADIGPRIGVCGDTGHWMRSGIRPLDAIALLHGRMLDLHLKDLDAFGVKEAKDVPFGQGKADIRAILEELARQNFRGTLTVEHENEAEADDPSPSILKGIEYLDSVMYDKGYEELIGWGGDRFSKHGWNHYGPGHFELDEKTGILKSQGGMGLLWYSRRMYRDFVLHLDFQCSQPGTNSGIFLRVPNVPTSDDYIYHSFEIQINHKGEGINTTGAVYDAQAPGRTAIKPISEWNHFAITFQGRHIRVVLNGVTVIDWDAEPRGKVADFSEEGYIGLQNHDSESLVYFRNIFIKEL